MKRLSEKIFNIMVCLFFIIMCFITVYPFLYAVAYSFSDGIEVLIHKVYVLPVKFTLDNYEAIFQNDILLNASIISVLRTVAGTIAFLAVTGLCAYSLSKKHIIGRKLLMTYYIIPMYIGGGLLPTYMVIHRLGLFNNFLVYVLPMLFSPFFMLLMKVYFEGIPVSLEEAAIIDGAGDFAIFGKIYFPLSLPVIATVSLFIAVGQWNSWFDSMLYVTNKKLFPLQFILQNMLKESEVTSLQQIQQLSQGTKKVSSETMKMAILVITTIPILIVYPFLQKYFVKGMTLGAVKM